MNKPERTCMSCRCKAEKESFIRIVKDKNGQVYIDETHKKDGRGMYLCKTEECISKAIKTKAVSRAFKCDVGNKIYEDLGELL